MKTLKRLLCLSAVLLCIISCSKEEVMERVIEVPEGKVLVETEIVVDGVVQSKTRASSEAGYTTGDGLYDKTDRVTVAAVANDGYELTSFYDKKDPTTNLGSSYTFDVLEPRTFKAAFARKYTITISASPTAGGTVSGGGTFRSGKSCTLTATPNAGYTFDGWYEGSTKLSSNTSYSFTVSSNRTITGKFELAKFLIVGEDGYIITIKGTNPSVAVDIKQIGAYGWNAITYGNGKYVTVGYDNYSTFSIDGVIWEKPAHTTWGNDFIAVAYGNGRFAAVNKPSTAASVSVTTDFINYNGNIYETGFQVYDVAYGNGNFVGVGEKTANGLGVAFVLNDASSKWSSYYRIKVGRMISIIFNGNKFVVLSSSGDVLTSNNGTSWSEQGNTGSHDLTDIAYGNGIYVGCGYAGYVSMSNDCITWTAPKQIGTNKWLAVTYGGGLFLIIGEKGYISSSPDGINWTTPKQIQYGAGNILNVNLNDIFLQ
ncbi:InlB B-repeat-containing protein [Bacteroides ovatus]|uniref:InlB B-repeat-containing protein n=1 Tax=Bacteroides ovatus TaxID=28116 RepID=UPI00202DBEF9|nr:hypothetical protein [Bacteroides ovatus]MCM1722593.1 hypothetical protein [Bacteroides ovatus]MCM1868708.1 hypothetical protein [Bacteroides ovatus]